MKYQYEDLSSEQFEELVILLCQELLGMSVQGFAAGTDGGRDAKFVGTAQLLPSTTDPWRGITIIQAKHTNGINSSFSDPKFYSESSTTTVMDEEIPRIRKLRASGELDHYMLFSNRRLTGNTETDLRAYISAKCDIPKPSICICGIEQLEMWLKKFPRVAEQADFDPIDSPLIFGSDELAEVVEALAKHREEVRNMVPIDSPPVARVDYKLKNTINKMSAAYAKELRKKYLKETAQIDDFLAAPESQRYLLLYNSVVEELQLKIIAHRKDYQLFDHVMNYVADLLLNRDPVLRRNKHLTRAVLFYMYWSCDIGDDGDDSPNEAFSPRPDCDKPVSIVADSVEKATVGQL